MTMDRMTGAPKVLLIARLRAETVAELQQTTPMLDGRDPAARAALIAAHAGEIAVLATDAHVGADRALIAALPRLARIACFSAGLDGIDLAAAAERGVAVTGTSDALAEDVADLAIAKCLLLARRLTQADRFVRDGQWRLGAFPLSHSLAGRRMGLIGMGRIGQAIARRAAAMRMPIAYTSRRKQQGVAAPHIADARQLAEISDILVVCCPATPETRHLVDAGVLAALGAGGWLINVARGSVVDEAALVAALQAGTVAGAGLDVFADEPHPHPALLAMDQVSLSPHVGSATQETRAAMGAMMLASVHAALDQFSSSLSQ